jgi:hypothetical protein
MQAIGPHGVLAMLRVEHRAPKHQAIRGDLRKGMFRQSIDGRNCLIQTVRPVEKIAKTSQLPREQSTEVGNPPKPRQTQGCASVATQTNPRPLRIPQQSSESRLWFKLGLLRSGKRASSVGNGASNLCQTVADLFRHPLPGGQDRIPLPWGGFVPANELDMLNR